MCLIKLMIKPLKENLKTLFFSFKSIPLINYQWLKSAKAVKVLHKYVSVSTTISNRYYSRRVTKYLGFTS